MCMWKGDGPLCENHSCRKQQGEGRKFDLPITLKAVTPELSGFRSASKSPVCTISHWAAKNTSVEEPEGQA